MIEIISSVWQEVSPQPLGSNYKKSLGSFGESFTSTPVIHIPKQSGILGCKCLPSPWHPNTHSVECLKGKFHSKPPYLRFAPVIPPQRCSRSLPQGKLPLLENTLFPGLSSRTPLSGHPGALLSTKPWLFKFCLI